MSYDQRTADVERQLADCRARLEAAETMRDAYKTASESKSDAFASMSAACDVFKAQRDDLSVRLEAAERERDQWRTMLAEQKLIRDEVAMERDALAADVKKLRAELKNTMDWLRVQEPWNNDECGEDFERAEKLLAETGEAPTVRGGRGTEDRESRSADRCALPLSAGAAPHDDEPLEPAVCAEDVMTSARGVSDQHEGGDAAEYLRSGDAVHAVTGVSASDQHATSGPGPEAYTAEALIAAHLHRAFDQRILEIVAATFERGRTDAIEEIMHNPQTSPDSLAAMLVESGRQAGLEEAATVLERRAAELRESGYTVDAQRASHYMAGAIMVRALAHGTETGK